MKGMSLGSRPVEEYAVRTYPGPIRALVCRTLWRLRGWEVVEVDHPLRSRWLVKYRKWVYADDA